MYLHSYSITHFNTQITEGSVRPTCVPYTNAFISQHFVNRPLQSESPCGFPDAVFPPVTVMPWLQPPICHPVTNRLLYFHRHSGSLWWMFGEDSRGEMAKEERHGQLFRWLGTEGLNRGLVGWLVGGKWAKMTCVCACVPSQVTNSPRNLSARMTRNAMRMSPATTNTKPCSTDPSVSGVWDHDNNELWNKNNSKL